MDGDKSTKPAVEDSGDLEPPEPPPTSDTQPSLLGRLLGWSSNGEISNPPVRGRAALGPAFRESSPAELAMAANILRLRDLRVEDVMTPRADIEAVAEDAALADVIAAFERGSFSRLPVYRETLDNPIGFVHLKDLALHYGFGRGEDQTFQVSDHLRTALFVPPSMRIAALLQKMQGDRVHMALVIDEFGGVDGLVTIEDLVEQIVGDIEDEHDTDAVDPWTRQADGVYLVSARADIREFEEAEGLRLVPDDWDEEVETLGGLVFMLANRVPARGEVITHPMGHEFEVVDADARRIKRLRLAIGGAASDPAGAVGQAAE
jgi:magnesium and cobalt transporter